MTADMKTDIRAFAEFFVSTVEPIEIDEILEHRFSTEPVQIVGPVVSPVELRQRRWWPIAVAVAAVVVLVGGVALLFQVTEPDTPVVGTVVPPTLTEPPPTNVAPTTLPGTTPTTVAAPELTNLSGCDATSTWSRVCDGAAGFDGAVMWSVTAGGPVLVAVGGDFDIWTPEDIQRPLEAGGDGDAVVWTSPDGVSWSRVPHDEAVFGGDGAQQIFSVTAGGPGLVAVGIDGTLDTEEGNAAVWTSADGFTWSRVPHDEAVFGGAGEQRMLSVTRGGPGLVAVGFDWPADTDLVDAAVWTSPDGFTWSRVPHDEAVFGGEQEQKMLGVTAGGPGLVAVGSDGYSGEPGNRPFDEPAADAAVWTSPDGFTWSRVPHDEAVFGGAGAQRMLSVTSGGPGLVAVGTVSGDTNEFEPNLDAAVWTSPDGFTWSRVPHDRTVFAVSDCRGHCDGERWVDGYEVMRSVTVGGPGLVAVGLSGFGQTGWDAAVWTSPDGITWSRVLNNQAVFEARGYDQMSSVTVAGSGLVAVGRTVGGGYEDLAATVWNARVED
jgi:hypothetical protein